MAELSLEHVSFLAHHLSPHASVWRSLGTALNFRQQNLDNIQSCLPLLSSSPYSFMQRLVEEWLEGKYPHTAPPTLANLLKALNSHTVGLGTLATQIRDSPPQHDQLIGDKMFEIASVSGNCDITFNRSDAVRVDEGTHVHLKVETGSELHAAFQWKNTGLMPFDSITNTPTLYIPKVNIDMDGNEYSCVIRHYRHIRKETGIYKGYIGTITTAPVTLRVSCPQLDKFKESLASIYLAQPEVPQDSWPPVSNKTYINLALIKQQQAINYGGEYVQLTIRGDKDDIHHKEKLEYNNLFDGLRSGSLFLIEGRPGSGKTTFVHKITRDWAASEVQGPRRLMLMVSLRVLNSWEEPVTLEDILSILYMKVSPIIIEERNGRGVCFIFDGLDEFSPLEGENSIVYKIINKTYLPQSIVIVASRPAALVKLRQRADKVVEVIGFLKDQIFEYIKNYQFSDTSKVDQLEIYFLSHPNILHMCYLPIHAAMVAFLFDIIGTVPRTETEMYTHFTRFTLMRSLSKSKGQGELLNMDANKLLSGELFSTICEHALEITKSNKQVLDQDQLLQSKDINSLGLVNIDRTAGLYGFKNIYTFLHLTFQEYLAAHHISTLNDEDQHKLIRQYGGIDHMQVVWKFYCGLVNFEGHEYKIKALIDARKKQFHLHAIQCAYESQQEIVCSFFTKKLNAQIVLQDKILTTTDFTALGYLLVNSSMPVSLSLIKCDLNAESAKALLTEIEERFLSLHALDCQSNKIDLSALILFLRNSSEPVSLSLIKSDLNYTKSADVIIGGRLLTLNALHCESNEIDLPALILLLRNSSEPVSLSLTDCSITNSKAVATLWGEAEESKPLCLRTLCYKPRYANFEGLSTLLSQRHSLESLKILHTDLEPLLYYHNFSDIVSKSLANLKDLSLINIRVTAYRLCSVPQYCKQLTSLTLKGVFAENDNTEPFLEEVSRCTKLETMSCIFSDKANHICTTYNKRTGANSSLLPDIHQNRSARLYVQGVRGNYLQKLMLEVFDSDLKPSSKYWPPKPELVVFHQISSRYYYNVVPALAKSAVSDFSALEKLILRNIDIIPSDAKLLANDILSHCVVLQELDLSHKVARSHEGIKVVLTGLKKCSKLQKLVLSHRLIESDGVCVVASCLQHWPKLQELYLRGCDIKEKGAKAIADNIRYCPELTKVDLSSNKTSTAEGTTTLLSPNIRSDLQKLVLSQRCIKTDNACVLASRLTDWPALQELHISGCDTKEVAKAIADSIKYYCRGLIKVDLSKDETSTVEGITTILRDGLKSCNYLKKLILNEIYDACVLASCLQHWPELQELNLRGSGIKEEGAKAIAENIKYCKELTKVDLSSNENLTVEGIAAILTSIPGKHLQKLVLNNIYIKPDDACVLASRFEHWPELQELHLRGCGIEEEGAKAIAENIKHCPKLTEVDLSSNKTSTVEGITDVFTSLKICSNLQKLVLNNIIIKTDDACVLASCLQDWPKLQELHLRGCGISEEGAKAIVDNIKHCPKLTEVDFSNDKTSTVEGIATILTNLKICSNLQKLVLNNIIIKTDDACVLASCLQDWPKLQELHLRGCGIIEKGAKAIADNIKHCPELTEVDLSSDKTLNVEGITNFFTSLKVCSNLQKLVLNNIYIKTDDACVLTSCFQHWPKLRELHLSLGCGIKEKGAKAIADNIRYLPELTEMDLSNNEISTVDGVTNVLTSLKICSNLQKLVLNNIYIKTDDACVLASCLPDWPKLQELHLRACGIKEEGAKAIADNIRYCPELTEVDLSNDETSTVEGITAIFVSLNICSNLQKLILNNVHIDARVLASCLQHWPKLRELHLGGCDIKEEGAEAIADNIKYCPELTEVDLSNNKTSAVEGVTNGLKICSNLQKLVLNDIYIKTDCACALASCLQHWPKLQELHLRGCGIEKDGAKAIADNIKYCPELTEVILTSATRLYNHITKRPSQTRLYLKRPSQA